MEHEKKLIKRVKNADIKFFKDRKAVSDRMNKAWQNIQNNFCIDFAGRKQ